MPAFYRKARPSHTMALLKSPEDDPQVCRAGWRARLPPAVPVPIPGHSSPGSPPPVTPQALAITAAMLHRWLLLQRQQCSIVVVYRPGSGLAGGAGGGCAACGATGSAKREAPTARPPTRSQRVNNRRALSARLWYRHPADPGPRRRAKRGLDQLHRQRRRSGGRQRCAPIVRPRRAGGCRHRRRRHRPGNATGVASRAAPWRHYCHRFATRPDNTPDPDSRPPAEPINIRLPCPPPCQSRCSATATRPDRMFMHRRCRRGTSASVAVRSWQNSSWARGTPTDLGEELPP